MSIIVIIGQSMHFFQAWKIFNIKSAHDISVISYSLCLLLIIHWLCYGILIKNKLIIAAESLGLLGVTLVMIGIYFYK